jgi:hypothetical protein
MCVNLLWIRKFVLMYDLRFRAERFFGYTLIIRVIGENSINKDVSVSKNGQKLYMANFPNRYSITPNKARESTFAGLHALITGVILVAVAQRRFVRR